ADGRVRRRRAHRGECRGGTGDRVLPGHLRARRRGSRGGRVRTPARPVATVQSAGNRHDARAAGRRAGPRPLRGHTSGLGCELPGWWGEGEMKFYLDGDAAQPEPHATIVGTGTEDYFGGAWDFSVPGQGYTEFTTPYLGLHQIIRPDGQYESEQRFGMYRHHVL